MKSTAAQSSISPPQSIRLRRRERRRNDRERSVHERAGSAHKRARRRSRSALGRYQDPAGCVREVVACAGSAGSVLVIDRNAATRGDRRLVAHIAADEPAENAAVVCDCFIADARVGRAGCRSVTSEDLRSAPFADDVLSDAPTAASSVRAEALDRLDHAYRLQRVATGMSIPELRWCRCPATCADERRAPVSVREVVAFMELYEPVFARTAQALARHERDPTISTAVLRVELARVQASPIVLNRSLREAVTRTLDRHGVSMSEIAMRCGRIKRDASGNESGETSWLARRLGVLPEAGRGTPTPWVHSDVLARIARDGLGISPREVEVE